jgi:ubiquinone/menaquinone biosynthesis C-methylase UbiE
METPDYGNWVPSKIMSFSILASIICFLLTFINQIKTLDSLLTIASLLSLGFYLYLKYIYWLLERNDQEIQKEFWNLLLDYLPWDGKGNAIDIGTGSGPVAILLAKKHSAASVKGIDFWGNPWTYSKKKCEKNAVIEGVSKRTSFEKASAVSLPFKDGEFDAAISNFVFHAIKGADRMQLIAEALRVLKVGGAFAFQDLFNDDFYSDDFLDIIKSWGLKEVDFVESSEHIHVPWALRAKHMTGGSGIIYGIK